MADKILPKISRVFSEIRGIEEKQEQVRKTMQELKRSVINQLGKEMAEEGWAPEDERRLYVLKVSVLSLLGKNSISIGEMWRYGELCSLTGLESIATCTMTAWLDRWWKRGRLKKHCRAKLTLGDERWDWVFVEGSHEQEVNEHELPQGNDLPGVR